ncbi:hypothetical protein, partial [Streptomyces chumphonensis]|uniref:hypothetical protein n=1 Tax=Streptomyces chumphonensis TaxID=1214925 RepID=UPI00363A8444
MPFGIRAELQWVELPAWQICYGRVRRKAKGIQLLRDGNRSGKQAGKHLVKSETPKGSARRKPGRESEGSVRS